MPNLYRLWSCVLILCLAGCSGGKSDADPRGRPGAAAKSGSDALAAGSGATPSSGAPGAPGAPGATTLVVPVSTTPVTAMDPAMGPGLSSREPVMIDACGPGNPAGLSDAEVAMLASASAPTMIKWLYPYDGTVFPRGMGAPLMMWEGPAADAVYVHIKSRSFEYRACLKPTAAGQLAIDQMIWDQAGRQTNGKGDDYNIELATLGGGAVAGPARLHVNIAQATIKGSIYYNTYTSAQALVPGGMVMRIPGGGGAATAFVSTGCNGCHSVSADGSRLLSQFQPGGGSGYKLDANSMANPPGNAAGPRANFGALYPDGSKYLATSTAVDVARTFMTQAPGAPPDATLFDAASGQAVPSNGIPAGALMPMFSPDGSLLVFNDFAIGQAHGLGVMKYDVKSDTASDYVMLTQEDGENRPAWPFVLPDNKGVVFARTNSADFSGNGAGLAGGALDAIGGALPLPGGPGAGPGAPGGGLPALPGPGGALGGAPFSELSIVDIASKTVTPLARAMGYSTPADLASGNTYLPFGAEELHHNYFPTVSPVAAGGYFWVFFDSLRHYGNLGMQRQLWGAAVEIQANGSYALDPSAPAFYVPGQELGTGNHRAFAALDPCKRDGDACNSGIDCCGGFCYFENSQVENVEPVGSCSPKKNQCARRDERCVLDSDCCTDDPTASFACIAGYCADLPSLD